jgi:fatty-acyl-CoA synthase
MNLSTSSVEPGGSIWRHTLDALLRRTVGRFPHKVAIVCGDVQWTYTEFDAVCNQLADGVLRIGISAGDKVAVLARNAHAFAALRVLHLHA